MPLNDSFLWAALCLLLLTLFHFASQRKLHDRRTLTLYAMLCCGLTITVCGLILTVFLRQRAAIHPAAQAAAVGVYLAQFAMPYLLLEITAFTCRHITSPFLKVARLLWCVGSILILSNPWTGIISAPQADGLLHVSACYGVFVWGISFWYMVDILYILLPQRDAQSPGKCAGRGRCYHVCRNFLTKCTSVAAFYRLGCFLGNSRAVLFYAKQICLY